MFHTLFQITVKQFPTAKSTFPLTKAPSPVTSGGVRLRPLGFAPDLGAGKRPDPSCDKALPQT